ncbi:AbrB/MazE/SpoVT family DNA-binding domain-containing protein [Amycolatopsis minnesotensis]
MTGAVIDPVAFPASLARDGRSPTAASNRPLPLPTVPTARTETAVYGMAAVDCRGRVADRTVFAALGWVAGTPLAISVTHGTLIISTDPCGVFGMTSQGHLRLPAPVRHCCGLASGDRVLLAAHPERNVLLVHPPTVLDLLLADRHARLLGGDLT